MYAEYFGFRELPFNNTPDPRFFYSTPDHEEALATLVYATRERKGFVLLTGEVGTGKTLITRMMVRHFGARISYATLNHSVNNPQELMESICTEFEIPFNGGATPTQLVRKLHDFLLTQFAQNLPTVLVLDEAQNLTIEAFEQLRMIGNLEADDAKLLQILIVGQPELQEMFLSHNLRQLRQRLFRSFHLPGLDRHNSEQYIRHRLSVVTDTGFDAIFDESAYDSIYRISHGFPRLINSVCDNALLSAYSSDRKTIDGTFVETVAKQMMLPSSSPADRRRASEAARGPSFLRAPNIPNRHAPQPSNQFDAPSPLEHDYFDQAYHSTQVEPYPQSMMRDVPDVNSKLNEIRQRLALLEHLSNGVTNHRQIHSAQQAIKPLLQEVNTVAGRIQRASVVLTRREEKLNKLQQNVGEVVRHLQQILSRTQQATKEANQAESKARVAQASLNRLIDRNETQRVRVTALSSSQTSELPQGEGAILKEGAAHYAETIRMPNMPENRRVKRLLQSARASLADLRDITRQTDTPGYHAGSLDPDSTDVLVDKVDNLVALIAPPNPAP